MATSISCAVVFAMTLHFGLLMIAAKRSARDMTGRRLMRRRLRWLRWVTPAPRNPLQKSGGRRCVREIQISW